jgi:hypothetical protein
VEVLQAAQAHHVLVGIHIARSLTVAAVLVVEGGRTAGKVLIEHAATPIDTSPAPRKSLKLPEGSSV